MSGVTLEARVFNLLNPKRGISFSTVLNKAKRSFPKNFRVSDRKIKSVIYYLHSIGKVRFSPD